MHLQSPAPKKCFRLENYGNIHIYHNIMTKHLDLFFKNLVRFSPQCKMFGLGFEFLSPIFPHLAPHSSSLVELSQMTR